MDYLIVILTYMIKQFNGNRTVFGAYHILKGKKSAQTIQDCHLFKMAPLFGVYKQLERDTVIEVINTLSEKSLIVECSEQRFILTEKGEQFLRRKMNENPLPHHLNGYIYKDIAELFWRRIVLTSQCLSFLKIDKNNFLPIIKDRNIQTWVRGYLTTSTNQLDKLTNQLYTELNEVLKQFSEKEATIFVLRLSGSHRIGLTNEQIASKLSVNHFYSHLLFLNTVHGMIRFVTRQKDAFPILHSLLDDVLKHSYLTETAKSTYSLLKEGLSIDDIAMRRGLKVSTVEDHVVEIAMSIKSFSIDPFVTKEDQSMINSTINFLKTKRLKEIKEELNHRVSYFAIRLTLAKKEVNNGSNANLV